MGQRVGRSHRKLKVFFTFIICTTTILAGNKKNSIYMSYFLIKWVG